MSNSQPRIVVTGASRGLGAGLCSRLAAFGWHVIAACRRPELPASNGAAETLALDLLDDASIAGFARALGDAPLDAVVHNAGVATLDGNADRAEPPLGALRSDVLAAMFRVNVIAPLLLTQALLPALRRGSRRMIVNVSSELGSLTAGPDVPGRTVYRSTKAALNMVTRALAGELAPEGFTCLALHPGWVRTDMGGPDAPLSVDESVAGMAQVIDHAGPAQNGCFLDYRGRAVPW